MGYSLSDALNRPRAGGRQGQAVRPPVVEGIAPRRAGGRSGERQRRKPQAARSSSPAAASASPAPPPRRALSDRELYKKWLQLSLTPDTPAVVEWPYIYLAARSLGLTRLGRSDYRPEQWRKAVQRLVREGGAIPFWWRTKGRPPRVLTTQQHLAAWAIAGYHLRLGRRRRT